MQHEALVPLAADHLDLLLVLGGAERRGDQRLGFAAREDRRAVRAGQDADLDPDRADLVELAPVEAGAPLQDRVAQHLLLQLLEDRLGLAPALDLFLGQGRDEIIEDLVHRLVVLQLVLDLHRLGERQEDLLLDLAIEVAADALCRRVQLLLAGFLRHPVDHLDELLDGLVRDREGLDHLLLGDDLRAGLHHDQAVPAACHHDVELRPLPLLVGRVDDVGVVNQGDTRTPAIVFSNGDLGQCERGGRAGDGQDVGVVFAVSRQDERDDLGLVVPPGGEQRTQRAVDDATGEDFLLARFALALEEAAGDPPRCVGVFAVVHREGKEVDSFTLCGVIAGGHEDDRVAVPDDDGSVRLLGQLACLDRQHVLADRDFTLVHSACLDAGTARSRVNPNSWQRPRLGHLRDGGERPPAGRQGSGCGESAREGTRPACRRGRSPAAAAW